MGIGRVSLEALRKRLGAAVVQVVALPSRCSAALPESNAASQELSLGDFLRLRELTLDELAVKGVVSEREVAVRALGLSSWIAPVSTAGGELVGAVVASRAQFERWSGDDIMAIRAHSAILGLGLSSDRARTDDQRQRGLDELVTRIAVRLMSVSQGSVDDAVAWTLRTLGEFFEVDTAYFRRNHHKDGVSVLIDEWPRRENVPDPDPLGVVSFDADPVFAAIRDLREPFVIRPGSSPDGYQDRVEEGSGIPQVSMAMVPLIREATTEGVLGFVNFRDRAWEAVEVNALQAIASLMMQLQARIDAEERLHHNAFHDELTGLPNRRSLLDELDQRLRAAEGEPVAVIYIDLDHFKALNDVLGHRAGDRVLVAAADRLATTLRPGDVAARFGGDEFVVVLSAPMSSLGAYAVADRLLKLIAVPVDISGQSVNRTASFGVAVAESACVTADELLARADAALYAAKARGRNQIVVFDDEMRAETDKRFNLEMALSSAIDDGELLLHYQPEVDLRTGRILAVEALVRWNHPLHGLLPAAAFITIAEESGLIVDIGRWVLEESFREMAGWVAAYPDLDLTMRVNMSPAELMSRDFVALVTDTLARHKLSGARLCLEITEHAVMRDVGGSIEVLGQLRALGIDLAIDDFGTGHSSMVQLKRLPVTTLKIDQSFVAGVATDAEDRAIVDSIARLAGAFGLALIAEGVESGDQAESLLALGCHRAQGYFFSKPVPPREIETIIENNRPLPAPNEALAGTHARSADHFA
jgi:diguanylate cyclase (GGDEF)-like protein